jgi:putative transposase
MSDYRRVRISGGTYFFTVNLADRRGTLLVDHIDLLRKALASVRARHPFGVDALVVLPDHMHAIWHLPGDDQDYSGRWREIKKGFTKTLPCRGTVWQPRFWEHAIRDEKDYRTHMDYIHINPLKHGLVQRVADWPHSTFHRLVQAGFYPADWAGGDHDDIDTGEATHFP